MQGGFAIGSINGDIRLYKDVGSNAKNLFPGLGEPIKAIDVSLDGHWVLATSRTYLLVVPTTHTDGESTGFEKTIKGGKPKAKMLKIKATDISKHRMGEVNFTNARFNMGINSNGETSIVTSTGDFLCTWNFNKVRKGFLMAYKIKKLAQKPVDNQFIFNNDESILCTMQKEVGVQKRAKKVSKK